MEGTAKTVWGYRLEAFRDYGVTMPVITGIDTHPHALITGSSGSGKSQTVLFLMGKLLQADPGISLYFCDFKSSEDFVFLKGYPGYYTGKDCLQGIRDYYDQFTRVRENGRPGRRHILIFDEYPACVNYLQMKDKADKTKNANDVLNSVAEILMLGRGIRFGIWIVTQRADSSLFANGARDNFMTVIGLGRLSKEQKGMVFPGQEIPDDVMGAGEGMLLADGRDIVSVKYPLIKNAADWKRHIRKILQDNL